MSIRVNLIPADPYREQHYGVILTSECHFTVVGRGIHNPSFPHNVVVWDNSRRCTGDDAYLDPNNHPTDQRYSYLLDPQSVCITAHPTARDMVPTYPVPISLGTVVELAIHGYVIGEFVAGALPLQNPHLLPVARVTA